MQWTVRSGARAALWVVVVVAVFTCGLYGQALHEAGAGGFAQPGDLAALRSPLGNEAVPPGAASEPSRGKAGAPGHRLSPVDEAEARLRLRSHAAPNPFTTTGSMADNRGGHTATLLPNGKVLVAGGGSTGAPLNSAELYDPASGTFTTTGSLYIGRTKHTATLLPNGKVLIAAGANSTFYLTSAELYDPASGAFTTTASLSTARTYHTATLLPNGQVLTAGGLGLGELASAELYDVGLQINDSRRPVITSAPALVEPGALTITGTGFTGDSEASGGTTSNSATNDPPLLLQRVDNEQQFYLLSTAWTSTSFSSQSLSTLPYGT
jgi:hypothetical protein